MIGRISELIHYRELLKNLVLRDLKVRYKNSALGILWSMLNPLLMTLVFTVVFTIMIPGGNQQENFPVFFMCGFLPWSFFSSSVASATGSIVANSNLIKKVYFPREILPLSDVLSNLVHFLIALIVLFGMLFVFRMGITWAILILPLIILAQVFFVAGMAFLLSAANVFYRDTEHILSVVLQAWFFLTPIFYPITVLPESQNILGMSVNVQLWARRLNPMASLIASYRDVLYHGVPTGLDFLVRTIATCLIIFVAGYIVFCRFSSLFGEEI
ncbi:MAG: ABC transporter permease [Anaerolineae bacterium]|jgi:ABC-type polysaccharide/polyol phosphate export permease